MSNAEIVFRLRHDAEPEEVLERIHRVFPGRMHETRVRRETYLDTFDMRLARAGLRLAASDEGAGHELVASGRANGRERARTPELPSSASELPAGRLRRLVQAAAEARRLLGRVEVESTVHSLDVLDEEEKTVVRLEARSRVVRSLVERGGSAADGRAEVPIGPVLLLRSVRGYEEELASVARLVELQLGLRRHETPENVEALCAVGIDPEGARAIRDLEIDPRASAQSAVRLVLRAALRSMLANQEGMLRDVDPEYLHEFRVALRHARAILALLPDVFPDAATRHYRDELRWLGQLTGPLRDLDVLFESLSSYTKRLGGASPERPEGLDRLEPLRAWLAERRSQERSRLVGELASARYRMFVENWGRFLENSATNGTHLPNARRPIAPFVAERLEKRFRRLLKHGLALDTDSPMERFHRLRIDAKRVRYLLELFRSLLPAKGAKRATRGLKKIQTHLGDLHDVDVHLSVLERFAREGGGGEGSESFGACLLEAGRLAAWLDEHRAEEREAFLEDFVAFAARKNAKLFRALADHLREEAER